MNVTTVQPSATQRLRYGGIGGVIGGILFGMMMQMMGMMPMLAALVGANTTVVGWVVYLAISLLIGVTYGALLGSRSETFLGGAMGGSLYGLLWWVIGPLLIMPMMMGMPTFALNEMTVSSLIGHLLFGLATGFRPWMTPPLFQRRALLPILRRWNRWWCLSTRVSHGRIHLLS